MNCIKRLKKNVKKLPEPLRRIISQVYNARASRIIVDKDMVFHLMDYFNLPKKEILWLLKSAQRLDADCWRFLNPKTSEEIENFYKTTFFYIFDLAHWHMAKSQINFRNFVVQTCEGRVLDFGAGIGDLCINLTKRGLKVDYLEIPGKISEFAKWLFKKKNLNIEIVDLNDLSQKYDTILCIDVIEHVINPQKTLEILVSHLNGGGKLIVTNLNINDSDTHPMHSKLNLNDDRFLNLLGLYRTKEDWLFIKK